MVTVNLGPFISNPEQENLSLVDLHFPDLHTY